MYYQYIFKLPTICYQELTIRALIPVRKVLYHLCPVSGVLIFGNPTFTCITISLFLNRYKIQHPWLLNSILQINYVHYLTTFHCKALGKDALETDQEETIVSASNTESEEDRNKEESTPEEKEHVVILGDEDFELPEGRIYF